MKKSLLLWILAGVFISASAQISPTALKAPVPAADEWYDIGTGTYSDNILASRYGTPQRPLSVTVQESRSRQGVYRVVNPWPDAIENDYLIINATDPDYIIVERQRIAFTDPHEGCVDIASYSWICQDRYGHGKDEFLTYSPDFNITLKNGVISFPPLSVSFRYPEAPRDSECSRTEWYDGERMNGYLALPGAEIYDPYPWQSIGIGSMFDNILAPMFQLTCAAPYQVVIEQSTENSNLYRVLNPWYVVNTISSPLVFDLTDPGFVLVKMQTSGLATQAEGRIWLISRSACYDSKDDFLGSGDSPCNITFNGQRITVPPAAIGLYLPDFDTENLYYPESPQASYIDFPDNYSSIDTPASGNNTPVEYYNLQGVRIPAPVAGQTVIRKTAGGVDKIILR